MGGAVRLRQDVGAEELRRFAVKAKDGAQARRLLALAAVHDGMNRSEAARVGGMDRQTLRGWVPRFNQYGPEGLIDIKPPGRPSKLSEEQKEALKQLVESGPDPATDGVVRWRCVDLKRVLARRFGVDLSEVSLGRVLKKLSFSHISARPQHPVPDPEAIATFKKNFPTQVAQVVSTLAPGTPIEVWFQDEMQVGQKNSLVYQWPGKDRGHASPRISATRTPMYSAPSTRLDHHRSISLKAGIRLKFGFPVVSPFRLRVSHYLDHATSPVPSTSNAACGFPALRSPICFMPGLMRPILLERLSACPAALDSR